MDTASADCPIKFKDDVSGIEQNAIVTIDGIVALETSKKQQRDLKAVGAAFGVWDAKKTKQLRDDQFNSLYFPDLKTKEFSGELESFSPIPGVQSTDQIGVVYTFIDDKE